jgi:hypothetical protein
LPTSIVVVYCEGSLIGLSPALMCLLCLIAAQILSTCFMCGFWEQAAWKAYEISLFFFKSHYIWIFLLWKIFTLLIISKNKIYWRMFEISFSLHVKLYVSEKFFVHFFHRKESQKDHICYTMPHIGVQIFLYVSVCNVQMLLIN